MPLLALPVTGGVADDADPAVVAIVRADTGAAFCTATVISERVVLTAAHCGVQNDPSAVRVRFGAQAPGVTIEILDAVSHPSFDNTESHDLALVLLAEPAPSAAVALLSAAPPAMVRIVGFGDTAGGAMDAGRKREGTAMVTSTTPLSIVLGPSPALPCNGDSGGPVFAPAGELAAVISRGDPACATYGKATRVDVHVTDFIAPYLAATAPGSAQLGDACRYDAQCTTGSCIEAADEPLIHYCSKSCTRDSDCDDAMICERDACRYREPTPGAIGSTCTRDRECARGECIDSGTCSIRCVSGRDDCPADYACEHLGGIEFFCTPEPSGGCCDSGAGGGRGALVLAAALYLTTGRRRSSRCT